MFKKFISALIIFSLFYTDVANAMQSEGVAFHDDMDVKVKSRPSLPPHTQPLRRVKSLENFNSFQGSPPKVFSSPTLALPIGPNYSNESLLTDASVSSSLDSKKNQMMRDFYRCNKYREFR